MKKYLLLICGYALLVQGYSFGSGNEEGCFKLTTPEPEEGKGLLIVMRPYTFSNFIHKAPIFINGEKLGENISGGIQTVNLSPNIYEIAPGAKEEDEAVSLKLEPNEVYYVRQRVKHKLFGRGYAYIFEILDRDEGFLDFKKRHVSLDDK